MEIGKGYQNEENKKRKYGSSLNFQDERQGYRCEECQISRPYFPDVLSELLCFPHFFLSSLLYSAELSQFDVLKPQRSLLPS
ncbi:hypothetical protein HN011_009055 [Eciton burchellii]|nr:hypothetical protein HN011_009055 [Eciton burchellii]